MNNDDYSPVIGDNNSYVNLRKSYQFCSEPRQIECRTKANPTIPFSIGGQQGVDCDVTSGLMCKSRRKDFTTNSKPFYCRDYEIRVECCECPTVTTTPLPTTSAEMTTKSVMRNDTITLLNNVNMEPRTQQIDPMENLIPLAIILGVIVFCCVMIGIILFVARKRNYQSKPQKQKPVTKKVPYIYTHGELKDFQKPVSFNSFEDVFGLREDRRLYRANDSNQTESTRYSEHDSTRSESCSSSHRSQRIRQLKYVESPTVEKIEVHRWLKDETQIESSSTSLCYDSTNDSSPGGESFPQWYPDESSLEKRQRIKSAKSKNLFASPPPPPKRLNSTLTES